MLSDKQAAAAVLLLIGAALLWLIPTLAAWIIRRYPPGEPPADPASIDRQGIPPG